MNPPTKSAQVAEAYKVCEFLGHRFGYRRALEIALKAHGIPPATIELMCQMARSKNLASFEALLNTQIGE